jgi:hypothetical protein
MDGKKAHLEKRTVTRKIKKMKNMSEEDQKAQALAFMKKEDAKKAQAARSLKETKNKVIKRKVKKKK